MKITKLNGFLTALSPIHTGSDESETNEKSIRTLVYLVDGEPLEIPVISGNSIRGWLRRLIMTDLLEQVGYIPETTQGQVRLYHCLFDGGTLETVSKKDSGYIDMALKADLRRNIPPLSLLGTAIRNQMLAGKLKVGYGLPRVVELQDFMVESEKYPVNTALVDLQRQTFNVRHDEMKESAKEQDIASSQMIFYWWYVPGGTVFQQEIVLKSDNPVEVACLGRMLELWRDEPYVGGKSGIGNGKLRLDYPPIDSTPYLEFLRDNKDSVIGMLRRIELG